MSVVCSLLLSSALAGAVVVLLMPEISVVGVLEDEKLALLLVLEPVFDEIGAEVGTIVDNG